MKKNKYNIKIFTCLTIICVFLASFCIAGIKNSVKAVVTVDPSAIYLSSEEIDSFLKDNNGKLAFWTSDNKSTADIVISYKQETNNALYLATLCNSHGQRAQYLSNEINAVSAIADVNLYLEGKDLHGTVFYTNDEGDEVPVYQGDSIDYRITDQKAHIQLKKNDVFNLSESTFLNTADGPTKGQYIRMGKGVDVSSDSNTVLKIDSSGEHANIRVFAEDIIEALGSGEYEPEFIIISFDAWAWAYQSISLDNEDDAQIMLQAAKLLEKYYKEKRVIWLTSKDVIENEKIMDSENVSDLTTEHKRSNWIKYLYPDSIEDFNTPSVPTTFLESDEFKNSSDYSKYRNTDETYNGKAFSAAAIDGYLEYLVNNHEQTATDWLGGALRNRTGSNSDVVRGLPETSNYYLLSKKAPFYQWAILDPETYLSVVDDNGNPTNIPNLNEWNTDVLTIGYDDANLVTQSVYEYLTGYNNYFITDVLAEGLDYVGADIYYYDEDNNNWIQINDGYEIQIDEFNNKKINISITNEDTINKRIRAIIHTECKDDEFCEIGDLPKNTNVGDASVITKLNDVERIANNFESPKLLKLADKLNDETKDPEETKDSEEIKDLEETKFPET